MALYCVEARTTAGSTTLPMISVYAGAADRMKIREVGCFNTTATAVVVQLVGLTTTGTQGAGLTEYAFDSGDGTPNGAGFAAHSIAPTIGRRFHRAILPATTGAVIWTWAPGSEIIVPTGTTNGFGVITATGTGQACDVYIVWDE